MPATSAFFLYGYQSAISVFVLVLHWLVVGLVARSPWRHHLQWAMPAAIASSLQCCLRFVEDLHQLGHIGTLMQTAVVTQILFYSASIIGIYGTWQFYTVVKQSLQSTAGKDLFTQAYGEPEPGVWPPPPRVGP